MCTRKVNCNCGTEKCFCGILLKDMDHVEIACCDKAIYHVLCIFSSKKCPKCKKSFDESTKKMIKCAEALVMEKYEEFEGRIDEKRDMRERIILQKKVSFMTQLMKLT